MKRAARNEKNAALGAQRVKVTVAQAAPVAFDRKSTLKKAHVPAGEAALDVSSVQSLTEIRKTFSDGSGRR
jgi:hypothetical protein